MEISKKLETVDKLKAEIDALGKLDRDTLNRINHRFRLDWNYYSNIMEGNTLSMRETRSIMIGNITVDGKPIKDVLEMKGHDEAIHDIIKMGKGELNISEKRIKDIHRAIMYEDDEEKRKQIGEWKKDNNYIHNHNGERYDFLPWMDVPVEMHKLINWLSAEKEKINEGKKGAIHPVLLAIQFHLKYLTIHPFYDGNGRTSRILMNLILIAQGFPPIIVKSEEKDRYYKYITEVQSYGAPADLYEEHMLDLLIASLTLVKTAAQGGDISHPDDIDKRLALLEKELSTIDTEEEVKTKLSEEVLLTIFDSWFSQLMNKVVPAIQRFNRLFIDNRHYVWFMHHENFENDSVGDIIERLKVRLTKDDNRFNLHGFQIRIGAQYGPFKKGGVKSFGCNYEMEVRFDQIKYEVLVEEFSDSGKKSTILFPPRLLHKPITEQEMEEIAAKLSEAILAHIEYHTKKAGLR